VGISSSLWKGKKSLDIFQAVPSSVGYMEPLEDSAWSQNVDSAASMYPPPTLPLTLDLTWGEDYQDLSSWCSKLQPETAADTEGSSCIAQDYELNTPEVGIHHDFNFTASCNVLKENSTSQYLSDRWDTSPLLPSSPLYVSQQSSLKEPWTKTDTDNTQSATANEFFIDDGCVLPVSHEEEIVTSHNMEGLNLECVQSKESDSIKKSVNLYALGVPNADKSMDTGNYRSVGKDRLVGIETETDNCTDIKMLNRVANTDKFVSLGSLLESDFLAGREGKDPVHKDQLQAEEKLDLKNVLSANSFHSGNNDELKSVDETWGCDTIVSKVTDTVLSGKCEIIRPVRPNIYMMQTLGCEEGAGKAVPVDGHTNAAKLTQQKETTTRLFGADLPAQIQQQSLPVNSELFGTATRVEISAKTLAGMSSEPLVVGTRANEDVPDGNLGVQPQMALKGESATEKNMKLNLSTVWEGTDDSIGISTPDVMEFLLKQNGNFDLIGYVFSNPKEFQQDLPPVNVDDRISVSYADETAKVEPNIEQVEQSPNVAESLDNTVGDAAVKVEVVEPVCIAELDDKQNDSVFEPMELLEGEIHCNLEHRSDQLCEGRTRTNAKNDLKGNKGHQIQKFTETRKGLLKSRILQDGTDLRLTISKAEVSTGRTGSKRVALPQQQVPQKENGSELKELSLRKRIRGRPTKEALPSTSEVKNETHTTNRPPRRKSCPVDEPWILPSKRTKLTSGESCDRYRELRDKNNEASRKSRQNRKFRDHEMKEYAVQLASENQTLKIKADEMERLVKKLRQALLEAVVKTRKQ